MVHQGFSSSLIKPKLRIRKIEKFSFNSPQLQLGFYEYYELALAKI